MKETINEIVLEILEIDSIDLNVLNREQNTSWDSVKHLEIIMAIEEEFNIRFTAAEVTEVKDIEDLYTAVEAKNA